MEPNLCSNPNAIFWFQTTPTFYPQWDLSIRLLNRLSKKLGGHHEIHRVFYKKSTNGQDTPEGFLIFELPTDSSTWMFWSQLMERPHTIQKLRYLDFPIKFKGAICVMLNTEELIEIGELEIETFYKVQAEYLRFAHDFFSRLYVGKEGSGVPVLILQLHATPEPMDLDETTKHLAFSKNTIYQTCSILDLERVLQIVLDFASSLP